MGRAGDEDVEPGPDGHLEERRGGRRDSAELDQPVSPGGGEPFAKGQDGYAKLVCAKDRLGNYRLKQHVASLTVTCDVWSLDPGHDDGSGPWRPTGYMERVSQVLEAADEPMTGNQVVAAITGKRNHVLTALATLVDEGYAKKTPGPNRSQLHTSAKPYREVSEWQ